MIDIIIPVYRGYADLRRCLDAVFRYPQKNPFHVVIIDDAAPEPKIADYLTDLSRKHSNLTLIRHVSNKGFIVSVNEGMALHPDRDVVILNSDAEPANDWLDRLSACAARSEGIGTVTPFSNNATICSFPEVCRANDMPETWSIEDLDRMFAAANPNQSIELPTGVGFCMFIRRACLNDAGYFDAERFGQGYGEENDFCMRAAQKGWKHLLCADTFVYHAGGVSFGEEKERRLAGAMETLGRLYPGYHTLVQNHISRNPGRPLRVNALLHMIRHSPRRKVLFINHDMGGGTEKHIRELASFLHDRLEPLILRPEPHHRVRLGLGVQPNTESLAFQLPFQYGELLRLCRFLGVSRVHVHHTMGLTPRIWPLASDLGVPMDVTLHDYYFINANPTLIGQDARFCEDNASRDECCSAAYAVPGGVSAAEWRTHQRRLLESAERIISPSRCTAGLFQEYFPDLVPLVAYHPDWEQDTPYPSPRMAPMENGEAFRILVLGALSREKGAEILEACAKLAKMKRYPFEFHLLGYAFRPLDPAVIQHGPYHDEHVPHLIRRIAPHLIWFCAQWPETYSYTLSAALKTALPLAAPDIGAFPERLEGRPLTWIVDWRADPGRWLELFSSIRNTIAGANTESPRTEWVGQPRMEGHGFSYAEQYLVSGETPIPADDPEIDPKWIARYLARMSAMGNGGLRMSFMERILTLLLRVRESRLASPILNRIPYGFQRAVKRKLSPRPIHEFLLRDERSDNP